MRTRLHEPAASCAAQPPGQSCSRRSRLQQPPCSTGCSAVGSRGCPCGTCKPGSWSMRQHLGTPPHVAPRCRAYRLRDHDHESLGWVARVHAGRLLAATPRLLTAILSVCNASRFVPRRACESAVSPSSRRTGPARADWVFREGHKAAPRPDCQHHHAGSNRHTYNRQSLRPTLARQAC